MNKIRSIMKPFILSDDVIFRIKDNFQREMILGLSETGKGSLPMTITFITERFAAAEGDYVAICAHAQNFVITLVKLKPDISFEIQRKDYNIDCSVFEQSYRKVYEAFAECVKDFFFEFQLDGKVIPIAFCSDLPMEHFSLDTAIIPHFVKQSGSYPCSKDIKSYFEQIFCEHSCQVKISPSTSTDSSAIQENSCSAETYSSEFDARFLGTETILGLDVNSEICHKLLTKIKVVFDAEQLMQDVLLKISPKGIQIQDKDFDDLLHHHPLNKISYVTQDFSDCYIFGYVFGDYIKGHQFFGFKTTCESTHVILFLQEVFQLELMRKKKEELFMKASQVFVTLKDFLNVAQDFKVKEREIPATLKKRVNLVEDICWWFEGCNEDVTPAYIEPEDLTLNVRIQELYSAAITMKLIEKEQEEEELMRKAKAAKKHLKRKKLTEMEDRHDKRKKLHLSPNQLKVAEILKECITNFQSAVENRKRINKVLKEQMRNLTKKNLTDYLCQEAFLSLKELCTQIYEERKAEIGHLKQKIEYMNLTERTERGKIQSEESCLYFGSKQFLKSVQMKPNENTFEEFSVQIPKRNLEASEISNKLKVCKEQFLRALKIRRDEVNELNYYISGLHFREDQLPGEESAAVVLSRKLFVKAGKMRLKEIKNIESILSKLCSVEEHIAFAIPDAYNFCAEILTTMFQKVEEKFSLFQEIVSKIPDLSEVTASQSQLCKELYDGAINLTADEISGFQENISKLQNRDPHLDTNVSSLCSKFLKDTIENRKKEFDELVSNLELLDAAEIDDSDNEGRAILNNCKDFFITNIVFREKEIEVLENVMRKGYDFSKLQNPEVLVTLKDIFYAALELEKHQYEKMLLDESKEKSMIEDEVLPVVYTLKDMFDVVSCGLKQKHLEESDDPTTAKTKQIYTSLEEFLKAAFEFKQKEVEIPLQLLKKDLESVISSMIAKVRKREMERFLERKKRYQALKISNSWKELFLVAAEIRKAEIMEVIPAKLKETKEEEAVIQALKNDERLSVDNEGRQVATSWRKIFKYAIDMKKTEIEQIKQLLRKPEDSDQVKNEENAKTAADTVANEFLEESLPEEEESPHSEIFRVIATCKSIFHLVIEKGSLELKEMEHAMKPVFNPEYDEESIELEEDEITKALNKMKQILLQFLTKLDERISRLSAAIETLAFLQENIKSEVSAAKESSKRYLYTRLEIEEKEILFINDSIKCLDEVCSGIVSKSSEDICPFTDLVVEVLSSKDVTVSKENQNEDTKEKIQLEEETSPKFTREQIHALLLEIESEQKVADEDDDPTKLEVLALYKSCKMFLQSALEYRYSNTEIIKSHLEKLEAPEHKKKKKKEKIAKALSYVKQCRDLSSNTYEAIQSERKFMQYELEKVCNVHSKEQGTTELKATEIVAPCRKMFSSFVQDRQTNLHLMEVEIGLLEAKENSLRSKDEMQKEATDVMKSEVLQSCKDLVIGSVDLKMKEIDDISSQLGSLNEIESNIEIRLNQLDTEEMKASYTKLQKVKDAVSTCKKLCISAREEAKKGVKHADEELQILKDVLDVVEDSVVTSTCIMLLRSSVQWNVAETYAMVKALKRIEISMKNTEVTDDDVMNYLNDPHKSENLELQSEVKMSTPENEIEEKDVTFQFNDAENIECSSNDNIASETTPMDSSVNVASENLNTSSEDLNEKIMHEIRFKKIEEFLKEGAKYISFRVATKLDIIEPIQGKLDKLKITVHNVENEDSKVFDICHNAMFSTVDILKTESQAIANEIKNLNKTKMEDMAANIEECEFFASSKRMLMIGIKDRNNQHSFIEFELMKLVRYQDSRIVKICKDHLVCLQESLRGEVEILKEKIKKMDRTGSKQELLEICKKLLQEFIQLVNESCLMVESTLQNIIETKMKIELEDAQFITVCQELFLSQIIQRKKIIANTKRAEELMSELKLTMENMDVEAEGISMILKALCEDALLIFKNEIEQIECELIKKMDINVSDSVGQCEQLFSEAIETLKKNLLLFKEELDQIHQLIAHFWKMGENEFCHLVSKYENIILSLMQRNTENEQALINTINIFLGKQKSSFVADEINVDALNVSDGDGSRKKLETKASNVLSMCKENIYNIVEKLKIEIEDTKKVLEELKSHKELNIKNSRKSLSETLPINHNYTVKQLALLEELEQEILDTESGKEELKFCEQLCLKTIDKKEDKIQMLKHILVKLNAVESSVNSEAAKLIFVWRGLCSETLGKLIFQNRTLESELANLEEIKQDSEQEAIVGKIEDILSLGNHFQEDILGNIMVKVQELKDHEVKLKEEVSHAYLKSSKILQDVVEVLEDEIKYSTENFEGFKKYSNLTENGTDVTELSEVQKVVEGCRKLVSNSIENRRKTIYTVNLVLKFFMGNDETSNAQKSTVLPMWQERFLSFMSMDEDGSDVNQKDFSIESPTKYIPKHEVNLSHNFAEAQTKVDKMSKLMVYKDLMQSLKRKRSKQPIYCISSWNDILVESFLLEQFGKAQAFFGTENKEVFHRDCSWDELMLNITELATKQSEVASQLKSKKETFIPLSSWMDILTKASDCWRKQINEGLSAKVHENTLLQWKKSMKPKEYSEFVAGYLYDAQDSMEQKIQCPGEYTQSFSLDFKIFTAPFEKYNRIRDQTTNGSTEETIDTTPWVDIFKDAYNVINEGNDLVASLKKQDIRIQYQAARLHKSWNDCFLEAVEMRKNELSRQLEEATILQAVAKRVKDKMLIGTPKQILNFEDIHPESWTEKISKVYQSYQKELAKAVHLKKREMKLYLQKCPMEHEEKIEENPLLKLQNEEIAQQGKRMLTIALDLKETETRSMESEVNHLKRIENQLHDEILEAPQSINNWLKILSSVNDFWEKGSQLPQQRRKLISESSGNLFCVAQSSLANELESGICSKEEHRENINFTLNHEVDASSWDNIFQTAFDLIQKSLEKVEKLGLREKKPEQDTNVEYLKNDGDNLPNWIDIFLDAAEQKLKDIYPNQLDLQSIFEQKLLSDALPSWNEILFIISNYNKKEIKKRLFNETGGILADDRDLARIRLMVSHDMFCWDHIILASIEEFLKDIKDEREENFNYDSMPKKNFVLSLLEKKFHESDELQSALNKPEYTKRGCKWTDLLPTSDGERRYQVLEELLKTKAKFENPTFSFKEEMIPNDLIWKHIFPMAVLVWRKKLGDYLNFGKMSFSDTISVYSKANELHLLKAKLNQEKERLKKFTKDVTLKSKNLLAQRFNLKNNDATANVMASSSAKLDEISKVETDVSDMCYFSTDEEIDSLEPEYFSVSASWREVFFAAVERNRKILYKLMEFQKFTNEDVNQHVGTDSQHKALSATKEQLKELSSANNVLDLSITLRELFDAVLVLEQKKLVLYSELDDDNLKNITDIKHNESEDLKAFDVIDVFKKILSNGLLLRRKEKSILEKELWKLDEKSNQNEQTSVAVKTLWKYYNVALKIREKENKLFAHELESLKDLKHMFSEYVSFGINGSIQQINRKQIRFIKKANQDIQIIQNDFHHKLATNLDNCVTNYQSSVGKRIDQKFHIDVKVVDNLLSKLDLKDQELLAAARQILVSIADLRKAEIKLIETEIDDINKKDVLHCSMENKIAELHRKTIPFLSEGLDERRHLQSLMSQAIDFIEKAERAVLSKIRRANEICKQFIFNDIEGKKSEIDELNLELNNLKLQIKKDHRKRKVAEIVTTCENYVNKISEKRLSEIQLLDSYLKKMNEIKVSEFHSYCTQYILDSTEIRTEELNDIEVLMEPLKSRVEDLDTEMSSAIDEALCEAFGIQQGMMFFKIQEENSEIQVKNLDEETISVCKEFYSKHIGRIRNNMNSLNKNLESLNSFKGAIAEELTQILRDYIKILRREKEIIKIEVDMLTPEINTFKENRNKFLNDVNKVLTICRTHFARSLEQIAHDIDEFGFQLKILVRGEPEEIEMDEYNLEFAHELDAVVAEPAPALDTSSSVPDTAKIKDQHSKDMFPVVVTVLQSGLNWREKCVKFFIDVIESLSEFEKKSLQVVTACLENYFLIGEQRREENKSAQDVFSSFDNIEVSYTSQEYKDCLETLLVFNSEALIAIEFELDRLTNTIEVLQEEKKNILEFCERSIIYVIGSREDELKNLEADLSYLLSMGSAQGSELLSKCKNLLQIGIDDREKEIFQLKNDLEGWSSESEVLSVITICGKYLESSLERTRVENQSARVLLDLLEEESDMSNLLYSPALEAIMDANNEVMEFLQPETYAFLHIQKQLESKDEKLIEACRKLYCSMLETFKIEKESILCDIENLQEVKMHESQVTDTEGKEAVVSFADLFLTTFNLKQRELERGVCKKLILKDLEKKKADINALVKHTKSANDQSIKDTGSQGELSSEDKAGKTAGIDDVEFFAHFSCYLEARQHENKAKMEKKVIMEFQELEANLTVKMVETDFETPSAADGTDGESESSEKTETFVNRVYEIKVQQIEEDISFKRNKICNVIKQRKSIMEDLIKSKRQELEESVLFREQQTRHMFDTIKSEDSQVICSLKDIFNDVLELKNKVKHTLKNKKELEKYLDKELEERKVLVNLDNIFSAVLGIKEEELEMIKRSKFKEIERSVKVMKREAEKRVVIANDKLEKALKMYRKYERSKALEYAGVTKTTEQDESLQEYTIPDEEIFPDMKSFQDFISNFQSPFNIQTKKSTFTLKDSTSEIRQIESCVPFIRPHAYALHGLAGHLLKLYEVEVQSLSKVLVDLKSETENAIFHGISFDCEGTLSDNETVLAPEQKDVLLDMTAVLNTNTSMLVLGSYMDAKCDISLNLRRNFGMVYFEKLANIAKWICPLPYISEVSVDIGIEKFGNTTDCLNSISTEFDWNVTSVPLNISKFEMFVGDYGLLEQIRFVLLKLHHQHLLCRKCDMESLYKNIGLSFDDIYGFLSSDTIPDMCRALPVTAGNPTPDDVSVALYACKLILIRGALLTSICLASVLERLDRDKISVIVNSLFVQEYAEYRTYIKTFISTLAADKSVDFLFCNNTSCAKGAAFAACTSYQHNRQNPEYYLMELTRRLQEKNKLFSVHSFMKLLGNPDMYTEAVILANCYLEHLEFDVPLSVVWAFNFLNEAYEEAEKILKVHPVSLVEVNSLICQKIIHTENFDLSKRYREFLKTNCPDEKVKIKAYRYIFDLLVRKNMYDEALLLVQEFTEMRIPLSNLPLSLLRVLHNFCLKSLERNENIFTFPLPLKETYSSSSDSDLE